MKIRWLKKALRNLDAEAAYIAEDNPATAQALVLAVRKATERLIEYPAAGRPGRVVGTKELVIDGYPYIIPYRVRDDEIHILRVFHTRRRPPKSW